MNKFAVGDRVYIAASRVGLSPTSPFAVVDAKVEQQTDRTLTVSAPRLSAPIEVASSFAQPRLGVLVLTIGDYDTETSLLAPLAQAVRSCLQLLLPDDAQNYCALRTREELSVLWHDRQSLFAHIVIVAHGRDDAILFGRSDWVGPDALASLLPTASPKDFVFVSCNSGRASFAKPFSASASVRSMIAPLSEVHGAEAAHLCSSLFTLHFLQGRTIKVAFNRTVQGKSIGASWRCWKNGSISRGA